MDCTCTARPPGLDELPDEILLQIIACLFRTSASPSGMLPRNRHENANIGSLRTDLEPYHIARLQQVSCKLQQVCLDDELWKHRCFQHSPWYAHLKDRRSSSRAALDSHQGENEMDSATQDWREISSSSGTARHFPVATPDDVSKRRKWQEIQDMANWDPSFPSERVSWYDEYIKRCGPSCVSWLETPRMRDGGMEAIIESRGVALYNPYHGHDGQETMLAVSPLDNGSVCLWDIKGTRGKQGSIIGRSKSDILFIDGPSNQNTQRSKRIDTGVTECVSVDHYNHKAYFAVQSHLIEVDMHRLEAVRCESFEWSITCMSIINEGLPLTVGTSLGIHLHDFRTRAHVLHDRSERVDGDKADAYKSIFDPRPLAPYAPLSQPTPISILHLPKPGSQSEVSDGIYVSGRFTNILHYDRRKFPSIVGSIYSGGLIKSLAAIPYPYSAVDYEVRRQGDLSTEQMGRIKEATDGVTIIAGGSYKLKGSLELYGLSSAADSKGGGELPNAAMKNRQTAAPSTILSVSTHGTRIATSDGSGWIRWFERDGFTECRQEKIGPCDAKENNLFLSGGRGELARKIVSTKSWIGQNKPNHDDMLFWTGERLGMINFGTVPLFTSEDFEGADEARAEEDGERRVYSEQMKQALAGQTNEIRLMSRLGYGPGV